MTVKRVRAFRLDIAFFVLAFAIAPAQQTIAADAQGSAPTAAIASAHPLATAAGHEALKRGGNAFDAAVAVAAALAVVEPYSSGLGGGGFWLLHRARDGFQVMVDARETAPSKATRELFVDESGTPILSAITRGGRSAGIPGAPAALAHVAQNYGKLPLAMSLAPAIRLARDGFKVDSRFARIAKMRESVLLSDPGAARTFLDGKSAPPPGYLLRQPQLALTLERIASAGAAGFYGGSVASALVDAVNRAGGAWELSDLSQYRVKERTPVRFSYRGASITAAALPSAGGIALAQSLNMLERFPISDSRAPQTAHLIVEAMRRAFQDRARFLGDPDFVSVPVERLMSKDYAQRRGSGVVAGNTGVLLNNEMDDFSFDPAVPNSYRLHGSVANAFAPGKRPLSSMTPAFVEDSKGVLVLGAPGGPRIVSQVLMAILDYVVAPELDLERIVRAPRYHHQWWPDRVEVEPDGFSAEWRAALEAKGHQLQTAGRAWGNLQLVFKSRETGAAQAASDPRGLDIGWY
jgi:gamma-glutamyltranspeptidase / glutathione hydrolase